jgi:heme exporter protein D
MEPFFGLFCLFGILFSIGLPIVLIVLFVMLVTSTKRQEALLSDILAELRRKDSTQDQLDQ